MLLAACAPTIFQIANENREHLGRLAIGMTRDQVLEVMGTGTKEARVRGPFGRFPVSNPYRTETVTMKDGSVVEVLLYCTDFRGAEFAISEDELTPIVLKDGRVIGWGRTFFEEVQRYEVRVR